MAVLLGESWAARGCPRGVTVTDTCPLAPHWCTLATEDRGTVPPTARVEKGNIGMDSHSNVGNAPGPVHTWLVYSFSYLFVFAGMTTSEVAGSPSGAGGHRHGHNFFVSCLFFLQRVPLLEDAGAPGGAAGH